METIVVNKSRSRYDVDITRQGYLNLGNPYFIGRDGTRMEVIDKFEQLMLFRLEGPDAEYWRSMLEHIRGKRLGCVCRPKRCHGDVLARLADTPMTIVK